MPYYDDPLVRYDDPAIFYDDPGLGYAPAAPPLNLNTVTFGNTAMEYWEITKDRAQISHSVWSQYSPTAKIGNLALADFGGYIAEFEPAAQARSVAQDEFDAADRAVNTALLKMKILGLRVAQIIDGNLSENESIQEDLGDVFAITPRTEGTILGRARALHPVWLRANTALAALVPPGDPITRPLAGTPHTAVMLKTLMDGFTALTQTQSDKASILKQKRTDLRKINRKTDRANKTYYQVRKATAEEGSDEAVALGQIPIEQGTPAPDAIDIQQLLQGGASGLQVLVSYEPVGGEGATEKVVEYRLGGVEAEFGHAAPVDPSGNALGPFTVGQIVMVRTKVTGPGGTRTSAVRTITIEEPI